MKDFAKVLMIATIVFTLADIVAANHSWGNRHWARQSNPLTLALRNNLPAAWGLHLSSASADWNKSSVLVTTIVPGKPSRTCQPTKGRVEVCDGAGRGTLGFARVWLTGDHIEQAIVRLSEVNLLTPGSKYNSAAWRQLVVCQEVGHTLGLDHQDENTSNPNLGSCMDYTEDPDGTIFNQLSNEQPNQHDYDQLEAIYAHTDSFDSSFPALLGNASAGHGNGLENSSEWGRAVRQDARGRTTLYELELGGGAKVITFVLWANESRLDALTPATP
jgi:hypothetical protein